jgi:hypothetical protein
MSDRHVMPAPDGWQVEKDGGRRPSAKAPTQVEAIRRAVEIVANDGGGQVIVHGTDGEVRENRTVEAGAENTTSTAATTAATSAARGARATAEDAADEVAGTAGGIAEDATVTGREVAGQTREAAEKVAATADAATTGIEREVSAVAGGDKPPKAAARDVASIAETTGKQIGDRASRTAAQVAGETAAAGRRARSAAADTADKAGRTAVTGADRAATIGAGVGDELEASSDRAGRRIHTVTERVAGPLDQVTDQMLISVGRAGHALNPVRVTGRTVGVLVAGALHLGGLVATRGSRAAQQGTRQVAGKR